MDAGFSGKNVIVTGASGGIGSEIARQFAAEGARVVVHFFSGSDRAEAVVREIVDSGVAAESVTAFGADLSAPDGARSLFDTAETAFGPVDVLIANAGKWPQPEAPVGQLDSGRWNKVIHDNLGATYHCLNQFMARSAKHSIAAPAAVVIGSTAGEFGEAGHADYAAAKSGLMYGLVRSLKNEIVRFAPRGRINAVCPGWTMTPMARKLTTDKNMMKKALQTIALKKFGSPADVANAVLFLASNRLAGHITGESLFVSGGMEGRVLHDPGDIDPAAAMP